VSDLPPGFEIPTPPSAPQVPPAVRVSAWILIVGGAITALGGGLLTVSGTSGTPAGSLGVAYLALGAAQVITGSRVLHLRPAFRTLGVVLAFIGVVNDAVQLAQGRRWQVLALLAHGFAAYVLATSGDAFVRSG
jgi:hypothetical protein